MNPNQQEIGRAFTASPDQQSDAKPLDVDAFNASHIERALAAQAADEETRSKLTALNKNSVCTPTEFCASFTTNMHFLRRGLKHAALNGIGTNLDAFRYCPWCGVSTDSSVCATEAKPSPAAA